MNFRYILLDWDGCLADTLGVWMETYLSKYKKYGLKVTKEEIVRKSWGNNEMGPQNLGIADYRQCWEEIAQEVKEKVIHVPLHQYTKELLENLKAQNKKVAIVTSGERRIIGPAIKSHHLGNYIDLVVTEGEVKYPKPDPEMLYVAIEKLGANREETVIIGDSSKDIAAGKNAGIATILILHETNKLYYDFAKLRQTNPDFVFSDLSDLTKLLTKKI